MNDEQLLRHKMAKAWDEGRDSVTVAGHDYAVFADANPYRDGSVKKERYYGGEWVPAGTMEAEDKARHEAEDARLREALKSKKWKARNRNARR